MPVPQRDRAQEKLDKIKKVSRMKVMAGKLRGNGRLVWFVERVCVVVLFDFARLLRKFERKVASKPWNLQQKLF